MSCVCPTWEQSLIENIPTIVTFFLVGGGGVVLFKFRDKLRKLFIKDDKPVAELTSVTSKPQ